jgi:hypothetical protein
MNIKKLEQRLCKTLSTRQYFEEIYRAATLTTRNSVEWRGEIPVRLVFFGEAFTPAFARLVLGSVASKQHFSSVEELRFVATRIGRELAQRFKRLNPKMRVYWIPGEEWIDRGPDAPNPAGLSDDPGCDPL